LGLLKELMIIPVLHEFFLVGGTALALRMGHRISVDLDLFTLNEFEPESLLPDLSAEFNVIESYAGKNTLNLGVEYPNNSGNIVKIDLIRYAYPLLKPVAVIEGIRMLETDDIIPMKLSAVAGRGSKKDFYDIYFLLRSYSLNEMLSLFEKKYINSNKFQVVKSLVYFDDAELEPDPQTIEKISWKEVKKLIQQEVSQYQ